jgi:hypothetical protein
MKVQLSQNPDVLGKIQVQNRNQQLKIYQNLLSLPRGKKTFWLCYLREIELAIFWVGKNLVYFEKSYFSNF